MSESSAGELRSRERDDDARSAGSRGSGSRGSDSRGSDSRGSGSRGSGTSHTWRSGGSTVARWDWELVGWAVLLLGAGILIATLLERTIGGTTGALLSSLALWSGMLAPVILAFVRSRPRMLLRFRAVDVLYGLVIGVLLRLTQGFLEVSATGTAAWPSLVTLDGSLPASFWFDGVVLPIVIAPTIEEFFFRAVVLVAVYTAVRRMTDSRSWAGFVAIATSTVLFVGLHLVFDAYTWWSVMSLGLVGLVCGALVVATSRIWPAVLTHAVYNATWVGMVVVGTL